MKHVGKLDRQALCELAPKILSSVDPGIGWEIGPNAAQDNKMTLALSSPSDSGRLSSVAESLQLPIETEDWAIIAGIPPRDWDRYFELHRKDGTVVPIEGDEWFWRWSPSDQADCASLHILVPRSAPIIDDELSEAAQVLLVGELGEANYTERVRLGKITRGNTDGNIEGFEPLPSLRRSFVSKFPSCQFAEYLAR